MKVLTLVGTRPELIRLSSIIKVISKNVSHVLVHTGQNFDFELNEIFYSDLKLPTPDYFLNAAGQNAAKTIGNVISKFDDILEIEKPDAFLVLGDTNSAFGAICAKKRKIPVFHLEAGNRSFDPNVPEEINRRIIDHLADINLTYSQIAKANLLREGLSEDRVISVGSPMFDVICQNKAAIDQSTILSKIGLEKQRYFVLSAHREENVEDQHFLANLIKASKDIVQEHELKCVFSVHPRTRKKLEATLPDYINQNILFLKPFSFSDYCCLQLNSAFVASDSGTLSEECSILGFRAINLRTTHERQEMNEYAPIISTGRLYENIKSAMAFSLLSKNVEWQRHPEYHKSNVSEKVLTLILSYTQYVNNYVWRK